jgi:hypothetical protein
MNGRFTGSEPAAMIALVEADGLAAAVVVDLEHVRPGEAAEPVTT